jgi:hypothetical protein
MLDNNEKESALDKALNLADGAYCEVSDFTKDLMKQREAGAPEIDREERHRMIVKNAIQQTKAKQH